MKIYNVLQYGAKGDGKTNDAFAIQHAIDDCSKNGSFPEWCYKKRSKFFSFIGRNSLWFYLGHQPAIYAILYAIVYITLFKDMLL